MICYQCHEEKPLDDFPWKNKTQGKRHELCKACQRLRSATHYAANKERYAEATRKRKEAARQAVRDLKEVPCADCGTEYPYYVMDFDHVRGEKISNVSRMAAIAANAQLREEVAKCDVVCANCHRERTHRRQMVL